MLPHGYDEFRYKPAEPPCRQRPGACQLELGGPRKLRVDRRMFTRYDRVADRRRPYEPRT